VTASSIVSESAEMAAVLAALEEAAQDDVPVLIEGERGTGRELIARAIHEGGERRQGRFVALRAASMSGSLLSEQLADQASGKLRKAQGGTLLLKEVSALPRGPQRLLMRALRKRSREETAEHVDVRLIAATDADLTAAASQDLFEPELAEQLHTRTIIIPPLRKRVADIPRLAAHFGARLAEELGRGRIQIASRAMDKMVAYTWPGNVAELKDVMRRIVLHVRRARVEVPDVEKHLPQSAARVPLEELPFEDMVRAKLTAFLGRFHEGDTIEDLYDEVIGRVERPLIQLVLERSSGNQLKAAKILGLNRNTLRKKIAELGIPEPRKLRDQ
jgi:two-component system nitrogen regulation response regulator GlnG